MANDLKFCDHSYGFTNSRGQARTIQAKAIPYLQNPNAYYLERNS